MSNVALEISYYLKIAVDINKKIGGKKGYECEAQAKDKFSRQQQNINKDIHWVRMSLAERDKKPLQASSLSASIKQKIQSIYKQIQHMKQCVNNDPQCNQNSKNIKMQIIDRLYQSNKALDGMVNGSSSIQSPTGNEKMQTLTDQRMILLDRQGKSTNIYQRQDRKSEKSEKSHPQQIELQAIKRYRLKDMEQDEKIGDLAQLAIQWKKKMLVASELIDDSDNKIKNLINQVQKVNVEMQSSNKKLKGIIQQYSKPHKFCIDVILILVLLGVLVGIIKVANS